MTSRGLLEIYQQSTSYDQSCWRGKYVRELAALFSEEKKCIGYTYFHLQFKVIIHGILSIFKWCTTHHNISGAPENWPCSLACGVPHARVYIQGGCEQLQKFYKA